MIDVVIFANGKGNLLRSIASVFYQVHVLEPRVIVYMTESFDESDYSSYPVQFCDNWKELIKTLRIDEEGYICFMNEGDAFSNPYAFSLSLDRFQRDQKTAVFGTYTIDYGEHSFQDIPDDTFHFYGKIYQKEFFFKHCSKEYSSSMFFTMNQILMYKDSITWDGGLRIYLISHENSFDSDRIKQDLYSDSIIEAVAKLKNRYPKASFDIVISTLLTAYTHFLRGEEIIQKEHLASMIPEEVSYSEGNLNIMKDNEVLIYLLQNQLSFLEFLGAIKEGRL